MNRKKQIKIINDQSNETIKKSKNTTDSRAFKGCNEKTNDLHENLGLSNMHGRACLYPIFHVHVRYLGFKLGCEQADEAIQYHPVHLQA
jgi:hypothetical protein